SRPSWCGPPPSAAATRRPRTAPSATRRPPRAGTTPVRTATGTPTATAGTDPNRPERRGRLSPARRPFLVLQGALQGDVGALHRDLEPVQRLGGRPGQRLPGGDVELAAVAQAVDVLLHLLDGAAGVRAHRTVGPVVALLRLGHHQLALDDDGAAADRDVLGPGDHRAHHRVLGRGPVLRVPAGAQPDRGGPRGPRGADHPAAADSAPARSPRAHARLLSRPRPGAFHRRPPTTTDCSTPGPEPKIAPDDTNDLYRNDPAPILDPSAGPGPRTRTGERPPPGRGIDAGRAALSSGRPPRPRGRCRAPRCRPPGRAGRKYRTAPRRPRPGRDR